jgi:general secretion pathway protein K
MRASTEEGIALIAVLWMLILLSMIAAAISLETHSSSHVARNMVDNAAARLAADAGIQRAILDLTAVPEGDSKKFVTNGTIYNWRFSNSVVRISAQKEQSKSI